MSNECCHDFQLFVGDIRKCLIITFRGKPALEKPETPDKIDGGLFPRNTLLGLSGWPLGFLVLLHGLNSLSFVLFSIWHGFYKYKFSIFKLIKFDCIAAIALGCPIYISGKNHQPTIYLVNKLLTIFIFKFRLERIYRTYCNRKWINFACDSVNNCASITATRATAPPSHNIVPCKIRFSMCNSITQPCFIFFSKRIHN